MSLQQLCGLTAQEITDKIMDQNGSNAFQKSEASENAYKSAVASYSATFASNESVTNNLEEASVSAFTSSVTASSLASVTSTLIQNTIVSNTSLLLLQKFLIPDIINIKTFNYYWDKYPDLFRRIQIVYTDVDENGNQITDYTKIIENNIKYLNEYYNKGYRLFIGFSLSSILEGVLPWFENIGIEAKGISLTATSSSLNFPKPIYRINTNNKLIIDSLDFIFNKASKIYYVYSENQLAPLDLIPYFKKYNCQLFLYPVKADSNNLTLSNIKEYYRDVDEKSISIMWLMIGSNQSDFVNLFNDSYPMSIPIYDIQPATLPEINETSKNALVNKYNHLAGVSFSTSQLFRDGLDSLKENFSTYVPNALLLINKLAVNEDVTTLPSHNSILQFDENNDIKYYTFLNTIYSKDDKSEYYYKEIFYAIYDPIVDKKIFYVNPPL